MGVPKEEYKSRGWDGPEWRDPDFRKEMEHRYWAGQDSGQPVSKEFMNFYKKVSQFVGRLWALINFNKLKKLIKRAQSLIGRGLGQTVEGSIAVMNEGIVYVLTNPAMPKLVMVLVFSRLNLVPDGRQSKNWVAGQRRSRNLADFSWLYLAY